MDDFILVIELTTRALHAYLVSREGDIEYTSSHPLEPSPLSPEQSYIVNLDPLILWSLLCERVRTCVKRVGPERIRGVVTTAQRFTTAVTSKNGEAAVLCPNVDARGAEVDDVFAESMGDAAFETTGLHPALLFSAQRLGWFKANEPQLFADMKQVSTIEGWVNYKLSGRFVEESSQAAGTYLFDIRRRDWSEEMLRLVGISRDQLPVILRYGELVGYASGEFQKLTGIGSKTPIIMGAGDTQCAGIGSAALTSGQVYVSLGSTAPLQVVMSEPKLDPQKRMWTGCYPLGGWVLESNSGICGVAFDWLASSILRIMRDGNIDYEEFDDLAESAPSGSADVCAFLGPSIMDARFFTRVLPAAMILPTLATGEKPRLAEVARAFYEDVAFACRGNLEQMMELWPAIEQSLRASGGLSKSRILPQILADLLGKPVTLPVERRATAVGGAVAGWSFLESADPSKVVARMVRTELKEPSGDNTVYESCYRRWRGIYGKLGDLIYT